MTDQGWLGKSAVDLIAVGTTSAITLSAVYNWGFFSAVGGSLVSILTIPDLLLGAAIAALPIALTMSFGVLIDPLLPRKNPVSGSFSSKGYEALSSYEERIAFLDRRLYRWRQLFFLGGVTFSAAALIWIGIFGNYIPDLQRILGLAALAFWGLLAFATQPPRALMGAAAISIALVGSFLVGRTEYFKTIVNRNPELYSVYLEDAADPVIGSLVRATSAHLILKVADNIHFLPMDKIKSASTATNELSIIQRQLAAPADSEVLVNE
jgi:hypothetical protein